jgi:hypothetical protein
LRSGKSNTNGNASSNRDAHRYPIADSEPDTYSSCRTDTYSSAQANACTAARATYANAHCHGHAKSYPYTKRYSQSDSATSAFAATAPITSLYENETHCSTCPP